MAKLSDYGINVDEFKSAAIVKIQGQDFPIAFTMETMEYVADIYDQDYAIFERDTNAMIQKKDGQMLTSELTPSDLKIMRTLVYSMLRTGGLDEDADTIMKFLGMSNDILGVYGVCMEIFSNQTFQVEDLKKIREAARFSKEKQQKQQTKKESQEEVETPWDFYLYVAITLLNWDVDFFLKTTPNLWLKSYINWLKGNTEFEEKQTLTLDKSPWW